MSAAPRAPLPARLSLWLGLAAACGGTSCVHVYEPLSGLHRPIVIDTDVANFTGVSLDIFCPPGGQLGRSEADELCRKVGVLFENQGAVVNTSTRDNRLITPQADEPAGGEADGVVGGVLGGVVGGGASFGAEEPLQLTLELRAREITEASNLLSWALCFGSFTLIPAVSENTFAQDVVVRDASGVVLLSDTLRGRIIRRFGLGAWGGNKVLDLVLRPDDEELTGDIAERELSTDLYQQLSQIVFNAAMRATVAGEQPTAWEIAP